MKTIIIIVLAVVVVILSFLLISRQQCNPAAKKFGPLPCDSGIIEAEAYRSAQGFNPHEPAAIQIDTAILRKIISSSKQKYIVGVFGRVHEKGFPHNTIILFPAKNNGYRANIMGTGHLGRKVDQKYPMHMEMNLNTVDYNLLFQCQID